MCARVLVRMLTFGLMAAAIALLSSADAQTLLHTLNTPNPQEWGDFGNSVALGDVNGDGNADIVVGAPDEHVDGIDDQGRAYVFSGTDASLLFTLNDPNPDQAGWGQFGWSVAVGDVNEDEKADIAVGVPSDTVGGRQYQGRAYVFSGADASLLLTLNTPSPQGFARFGESVATGDVNGDGKADIAVGASGAQSQGRTYVFSGADGSLLYTLNSPNPQTGDLFGQSVAVGDVNGDVKADIAVGAAYKGVGGNSGQGRAYVFSGADGSLLYTLDTPNPHAKAWFGWSVTAGDVNGDGKADIAVGAPIEDVGGNVDEGRAYVFSGADGSLLFTLSTPNPQVQAEFGWSIAGGDVNGDGKQDIVVGVPTENAGGNIFQGRAYVFSGADGSLLFALDTPNPRSVGLESGAEFGYSVAVGDVNGDGRGEIAVGAASESVGDNISQGRAYVFPATMPTATPTSTPTAIPSPTRTPTVAPARPPGVGGIVNLPPAAVAAESGASTEDSGWTVATYAALAGLGAAVLLLATGAWYAGRRWLR